MKKTIEKGRIEEKTENALKMLKASISMGTTTKIMGLSEDFIL